ncbi:MAG: CsgG/HfaB family protein [Spirochaetota bacterium]
MHKPLLALFLSVMSVSAVFSAQRTRVGILPFQAKGVSASDADVVSELFRNAVVDNGQFDVLDRNNMGAILKEQEFQKSGCTESECAVKIGRVLNMQYMFYGSLMKLGDSYIVSVGLADVETSKIVKTAQERFSKIDQAIDNVKTIAETLARTDTPKPVIRPPAAEQKGDAKGINAKTIVFFSSIGVAAAGGAMNIFGFLDYSAVNAAEQLYRNATSNYDTLYSQYETVFNERGTRATILNISAWSCYAIAAGLFTWWLFMPDTIPTVSVMPNITTDSIAIAMFMRF